MRENVTIADTDLDGALSRFGLSSFRSGQRDVMTSVVSGRDVLCVMPTGGGKSLCYQLPALLLPGVTLVVSPLIALMKDQEDQLHRMGIAATTLHSGIEPAEQRERLRRIGQREFDLVYVAPERFRSPLFLEAIRGVGLSLLAIDEAHCISEWGHDFRPDYARLGWFRSQLGFPTTIALTATATDQVRRDIVEQLRLREPSIFIRGFDRPNLSYNVWGTATQAQKQDRLVKILRESKGAAIVYAASRKSCEQVAEYLRSSTARTVEIYHAGMLPDERRVAQDRFMSDKASVVVATNAFGMGIDKSDIRAVVHYNMPGTLEAYYQEAGRAGRDGKPARCDLLFAPVDRRIQEFFIENEYPDRTLVYSLLEFLRDEPTNPIELTREEIKDRLGGRVTEMAIGTSLKLLEQAGMIERLRPRQNMAILRIHETGPDLGDLVPAAAKLQVRVIRALDQLVGRNRGQDVYFHPDALADSLGVERSALLRAIRELTERLRIEFVPPFRGNAIHVLDRTTPTREVGIDFDELRKCREREMEKLDRVFDYARGTHCRRLAILRYFGDKGTACGNCDNCGISASRQASTPHASEESAAPPSLTLGGQAALRTALAAVAELRARFGKTTVAQCLTGSGTQRLAKLGIPKKAAFGALKSLTQPEVVMILDSFMLSGLAEQQGDRMRPLLGITVRGAAVLRGELSFPESMPLPPELVIKLSCLGAPNLGSNRIPPPSKPVMQSAPPTASPLRELPPDFPPERIHPAKSDATPARLPLAPERPSSPAEAATPPTSPAVKAIPEETPQPEMPNLPEFHWTLCLLDRGFSVAECAAIRRLSPLTILEHAREAIRRGKTVPLEPFARHPFDDQHQELLADMKRQVLWDGNESESTNVF